MEKNLKGSVVVHRILRTYGVGESYLEERLKDIKNKLEFGIGFQAHPGHVDIKLCARARNKNLANKIIRKFYKTFFCAMQKLKYFKLQ